MKKFFTLLVLIAGISISLLISTEIAIGKIIPMMGPNNSCGANFIFNLYLYDSDNESWHTVKDNCLKSYSFGSLNTIGNMMVYAERDNSIAYADIIVYNIGSKSNTTIAHLVSPPDEMEDITAYFNLNNNIIYNDNGILKEMDTSGTYVSTIVAPPSSYKCHMFWLSPDRSKIIVVENIQNTEDYLTDNYQKLVMYNADGTNRVVIKPDYLGDWNNLSWKPDSSGIFYYHYVFINREKHPRYVSFDISGGSVITNDLSTSDIGIQGMESRDENVCFYTRCGNLLSLTYLELYDEEGMFIEDKSSTVPFITESRFGGDEIGDVYFSDLFGNGFYKYELTCQFSNPPDKPTLSSPSNGTTNVSLTPTLQTGSFLDPDTGDTHLQTEWQVSMLSDFSFTVLNETSSIHLTSLTVPHLTLSEGTIYYWRVRFFDNNLSASEWSDTYSFTTLLTMNDQNGNGIPDSQENDTVDLDSDGTPDIQQGDIKSLNTVVGEGQMGVSRKDATNVTSIESIESLDPHTISETARPYSMALGLFALNLNVANAGDAVQVTVYFSEAAPVNAKWLIYDPINGWQDYSNHSTFSNDRKTVLLDLQDGGYGDADGFANGVIVDPGGFGLASWIEGYVTDGLTGQAITTAEIGIQDLNIKTTLDGHYLSMVLPGTYSCNVSASGYQTINRTVGVPEGGILSYNFKMSSEGSGGDCSGGGANTYFPHIANDTTWETEICIINKGSQSLSGELRAYDNSGKLVDSKCISLSSKARREIIIGNEFSNPSNISYIIFESDSQDLCGYTKFYINGRYRVAIPAASHANVGDVYVSHIASDTNWTTGISILNTTSSSKNLNIEFDNGTTKTVTIAANEHKAFTISELFDGQSQPGINSAVIKNGSGIVGLEIFGSTASSGANYLSGILLKDDTATNIYFPHVASDSIWGTGIVAYNPSGSPCNLTITPYTENGAPLSVQTQSLAGQQKYIGSPADLNLPDGTAWFSIEASSPITGFELFSTLNGNQLGGYTGVGISGTDGVFAKIYKDGTGIAFVNIENASAVVTMTSYDDNGSVIATEPVNLSAHEKKVNVPSKLFSQDISTASYITYSSDREVVGFQLNVSSDGMMLDALPGM